MERIILTDDVAAVRLPSDGRTLCVRHRSYPAPAVDGNVLEFSEFASHPRELLRGVDRLVVVGLNKIITPGNRTAEVFEVLFNNTPDLPKVSVDHAMFAAEPWRAWFHFGLTNTPFDGYTYSYLVESHYGAWIEGVRDSNPVSLDVVLRCGRGGIRCDYPAYFGAFEVETVPVGDTHHAEYQRLKERCFTECTTARQIIARLGRFAQEACPQRYVPSLPELFASRPERIVATDLRVDAFLVERLREAVGLTDGVAQEFYRGSRVQERGRAHRRAQPNLPGF